MAYDVSNLKNNRGGSAQETSDKESPKAGLYRHPETGQEVITQYDPLFGDAQSEGFVRVGFVRVGDAPEGAVKSIVEAVLDDKAKTDTSKDVAELAARFDKLDGVVDANKELAKKNAALEAELAALKAGPQDGQSQPDVTGGDAQSEDEEDVDPKAGEVTQTNGDSNPSNTNQTQTEGDK